MAIDIREISLTDEQKRRVAEIAEQTGRSWRDVLNEQLGDDGGEDHVSAVARKNKYIEDLEKWRAYFNDWLARRKSYNPNFDDSRESIYP